jgi:hypothetical protein
MFLLDEVDQWRANIAVSRSRPDCEATVNLREYEGLLLCIPRELAIVSLGGILDTLVEREIRCI